MRWWLNPWGEARRLRAERESWQAQWKETEDRMRLRIISLTNENTRLHREVDAHKALPDGMPSTATPEAAFILIPRPDGSKRVWASKELTGTAFSMQADPTGPPRWKIGAVMANSLTVDGPSYGHCIERILQIWANWLSNAKGLPEAPQRTRWQEPQMPLDGHPSIALAIEAPDEPDK